MKFLQELFCTHIYHKQKSVFLREYDVLEPFMVSTYSVYAEYEECLKCGKERIVERDHIA